MISLYDHQKTALALLRVNDGFALFMEQGTGKTFPVLFRLAELASSGRITSAIVVAPKAVCGAWKDKLTMLDDLQQDALNRINLLVVSYDMVWRRPEYTNRFFDAVVLDESHYVKSPAAKRTKACLKICSHARYRYILTGTPTSNGQLCNIWSQFAAIDPVVERGRVYPRCLGGDSYYAWIDRVAYLNKWHKPYKYRNVAALQEIIGEMSYRITKDECLDLPEKMPDEVLRVKMGASAAKDYKAMAEHSALVDRDTLAGNPLVRALRLRQIASGYMVTDSGEVVEYDHYKVSALLEFLEGFEGKFVVFCEFRHSIDSVTEALDSAGIGYAVLDGRTSNKDSWKAFQEDGGLQAFVCQYQSGSAGIDLYAADTCIFFEPTLSSVLDMQAHDRIHRIGQKRACSYYYLICDGTIEWAIYRSLRNYEDFSEALFDQYLDEYLKGARVA